MSKKEQDTEQKIKEAARKIFQEKGFAATKTRDIAEAADVNLALVNYYFRSKKKLFDIVMVETMKGFFSGIIKVLNNEETTIKEKIAAFVEHEINFLTANPNVATFMMHTVRENPQEFLNQIGMLDSAKSSYFFSQVQKAMSTGQFPPINPIHLIMNLMGMIVFPFIAQPMLSAGLNLSQDELLTIVQERKRLIPLWIESMLNVK